MFSSLFYGFTDYWSLYHKVAFDGINKLILISNDVTIIDVQIDIYSAWKEWVMLEENSRFERALDTVGGEPTVAGQRLDVTYFLVNGWKIKPYPGSYTLNIIGNIFDIDGGQIKVDADINPIFPNNITINTNTSVIVRQVSTTTGGGTGDTTAIEAQLDVIEGKIDGQTSTVNTINTKLDTQGANIVTINNRLISIQSILAQPVQATLVSSQEAILLELQAKINELHKLHGLQTGTPLVVTKTSRVAGDINQVIAQVGDQVTVIRP